MDIESEKSELTPVCECPCEVKWASSAVWQSVSSCQTAAVVKQL